MPASTTTTPTAAPKESVALPDDSFGGIGKGVDGAGARLGWGSGVGSAPEVNETARSGYVVYTIPRPTIQATGEPIDATFAMVQGAARRARRAAAGGPTPFRVNSTTGDVEVFDAANGFPLDFETKQNYSFAVRVTAGGADGVAPFDETWPVFILIKAVACPAGQWSVTGTHPCNVHTACPPGEVEVESQAPSATADRACIQGKTGADAALDEESDSTGLSIGLAVLFMFLLIVLLVGGFMYKKIAEPADNSKEDAEEGSDTLARNFDEAGLEAGVNPMYMTAGDAEKTAPVEGTYAESGPGAGGKPAYEMANENVDGHEYMDTNVDNAAGGSGTYDMAANVKIGGQEQTYELAHNGAEDASTDPVYAMGTSTGDDQTYELAHGGQDDPVYGLASNRAPSQRRPTKWAAPGGGEEPVYDMSSNTQPTQMRLSDTGDGNGGDALYDTANNVADGHRDSRQVELLYDTAGMETSADAAVYETAAQTQQLSGAKRSGSYGNALDTVGTDADEVDLDAVYDMSSNTAQGKAYQEAVPFAGNGGAAAADADEVDLDGAQVYDVGNAQPASYDIAQVAGGADLLPPASPRIAEIGGDFAEPPSTPLGVPAGRRSPFDMLETPGIEKDDDAPGMNDDDYIGTGTNTIKSAPAVGDDYIGTGGDTFKPSSGPVGRQDSYGLAVSSEDTDAPPLPTKAKHMTMDGALEVEMECDDAQDAAEGYLATEGYLGVEATRNGSATSHDSDSFSGNEFQLASDASLRLKSVRRPNPLFRDSVMETGNSKTHAL